MDRVTVPSPHTWPPYPPWLILSPTPQLPLPRTFSRCPRSCCSCSQGGGGGRRAGCRRCCRCCRRRRRGDPPSSVPPPFCPASATGGGRGQGESAERGGTELPHAPKMKSAGMKKEGRGGRKREKWTEERCLVFRRCSFIGSAAFVVTVFFLFYTFTVSSLFLSALLSIHCVVLVPRKKIN